MICDVTHSDGCRRVHSHRISQVHLEGLHVNFEQSTTKYHHPTLCLTRVQIREGDTESYDHGGKVGTVTRGDIP